ncbi:hypothetical protein ADK60_31545, partial [Streptomyces sp. XY431]|uniref:hypothetical protein n=1 Tax=Streptomyces sp. XY431 TaxID=1415562 RepID=UPI0006AFB54B
MSTNRSRRIDRDTAERLLAGAVGGPSDGQDASLTGPDGSTGRTGVARVLAAAAAPVTQDELAGEEAALAAFREARLAPVPAVPTTPAPVRRRSMATAALTRAFSTKAAAVVLGATALGGVAVAAGTGNLPSALGGGSDEPRRGVVPVTSAPPSTQDTRSGAPTGGPAVAPFGSGRTDGASGSVSGGPTSGDPSARANRPQTPGASAPSSADGHGPSYPTGIAALCKAFSDRAGKGERPRTLVADPQFGGLVLEAGGPDRAEEYCARVLSDTGDGDHQGGSGTGSATGGNASTGRGSGGPGGSGSGGSGSGSGSGSGENGGSGKTPKGATPPSPTQPPATQPRPGTQP